MTTETPQQHHRELASMLAQELGDQAARSHTGAAHAQRNIILAGHALEVYPPGSPWAIAEQTIMENSRRVYAAETANAEALEETIAVLRGMDGPE